LHNPHAAALFVEHKVASADRIGQRARKADHIATHRNIDIVGCATAQQISYKPPYQPHISVVDAAVAGDLC